MKQEGIEVAERAIHSGALARASEAFLTNSLSGVVPLLEVNRLRVGRGAAGPVTRALAAAFQREIA
jgi:branched-subunit amino acid aminotransferase/4-amino-4-deoxychorismate lyase